MSLRFTTLDSRHGSIGAFFCWLVVWLGPLAWGGEVEDRAIRAGIRALVGAQSADGAWRSRVYGGFKDGWSLTPSVLKCLAYGPVVEGSEGARERGAAWLAGRVGGDGVIDEGPAGRIYPVYADSAGVLGLVKVRAVNGPEAVRGLVADLRRRQLDGQLGWRSGDPAFGAWGYAIEPAERTEEEGRPVDADLSSTLFAVGALRVSGASADDPAVLRAREFVERCQNFGTGDGDRDDGGFFLTPTDPERNKAGSAGPGRFHSYGGPTADGLRALLRCGVAPDHPRVVAARKWLERHFDADHVPGVFEKSREGERDATYYYYAWSVAHAFRSLGVRTITRDGRKVDWAAELGAALIARQRADGSWTNRFSASKEDDPLVATPFALGALANGQPSR